MKRKKSLLKLTFTALFAALIAACTLISIPMPSGVPITLQTFAVALCGFILPLPYAAVAVVVYLAVGAVGLPVFAGFRGGLSVLASATGGFLVGFIPMAALSAVPAKGWRRLIFGFLGVLVCHTAGFLWSSVVSGVGILPSFIGVSLPYLPKDFVSVALAYLISVKLRGIFLKFYC